ncbi:MAG: hypothetical protein FWH03_04435 [Firmicutes bacterium]|nr:hypothetical protein [Bacillota bacterium]
MSSVSKKLRRFFCIFAVLMMAVFVLGGSKCEEIKEEKLNLEAMFPGSYGKIYSFHAISINIDEYDGSGSRYWMPFYEPEGIFESQWSKFNQQKIYESSLALLEFTGREIEFTAKGIQFFDCYVEYRPTYESHLGYNMEYTVGKNKLPREMTHRRAKSTFVYYNPLSDGRVIRPIGIEFFLEEIRTDILFHFWLDVTEITQGDGGVV